MRGYRTRTGRRIVAVVTAPLDALTPLPLDGWPAVVPLARTCVPDPARLLVVAYGKPITQGSKIRNRFAGVRDDNALTLHPWRDNVRSAALDEIAAAGWDRLDGPVAVRLQFAFDRPASAPKRRRIWPITTWSGDVDKLCRSCLDSLTDAGAWRGDQQVVDLRASKGWAGDEGWLAVPGVRIDVREVLG